jgi:hypothetical protein
MALLEELMGLHRKGDTADDAEGCRGQGLVCPEEKARRPPNAYSS